MNHAWETYELTPILSKSHLIYRNMPHFDDLAKYFSKIFNKRNIFLMPTQDQSFWYNKGFFFKKYFWFNVINDLRRCDLVRRYAMLGNTRHGTTKFIWCHKNTQSILFDTVEIIWYKDFKKYSRSNLFFVDLKNIVFQRYFSSGTP